MNVHMLMEATKSRRTATNIGATVRKHEPIMKSLLAVNSLSDCDTVLSLSRNRQEKSHHSGIFL